MEIIIPKTKNSSIERKIPITLESYTILAGENNSGKTNLAKAIMVHDAFKDYKKIFIPAENIQPQKEELKTSAANTEFSKLLKFILGPIFDKTLLKPLVKNFDSSPARKKFVNDVNKILKDFGITKKKFGVKINEDKFNEDLIIKITKAFAQDLYESDIDEVSLENIGMGTQRLMVAALIQYYESQKIKGDEKVLIVFEEPEIYLHPRLKKKLHETLLGLSGKTIMVLITTHDPYFIELGKSEKIKIYKVYRDKDNNDTTTIKDLDDKGHLTYRSDSEINYIVFGIPSKTYFLELYEYAYSFFSGDDCYKKFNDWLHEQNKKNTIKISFAGKNPLVSKLRHQLGHPRKETMKIKEEEIMKGIKELEKIIQLLEEEKKEAQKKIKIIPK